jgi:biofilm PGA synthesis N-glycosyltransferase PgaC
MIIALLPAHNEAFGIEEAVASLHGQTLPPDEILVVCDNCTDDTAALAAASGARVTATVSNTAKKAGALNQALARELSRLEDDDYVLIMDADSLLDPTLIEAAVRYLDGDRKLGGVSGTFRGGCGGGFVGWLQRNEYARYARDVRRLKGKALVLTGTASIFRVAALRDIHQARHDGRLPFGGGRFYDEHVLTEDNELTLALMHCGWKILAPRECTLTTEVMESWRELARQRLRWKRGALENLIDYGLTRVTASYWRRQLMSLVSILATFIYLGVLAYGLAGHSLHIQVFWLAVTAVFCLERCVSVRDRGWKVQLIALTLVIEMVFDIYLQGVQAWAFANTALRRKAAW